LCLIRRSRQLLVAIALNRKFISLQHCLLEAALSSTDDHEKMLSHMIGSSFPLRRTPSRTLRWTYNSPLEKDIDDYLASVEDQLFSTGDNVWVVSLITMKKAFLINFVLSGLNRVSTAPVRRRRLLRLLHYILESEVKCTNSSRGSIALFDADMNCSSIRAITSSMYQCLEQSSVDGEMVTVLFVSSVHSARAPFCSMDGTTLGTMIEWSRKRASQVSGKSMIQLSKTEIDACYA
jgi:hypothetical protein